MLLAESRTPANVPFLKRIANPLASMASVLLVLPMHFLASVGLANARDYRRVPSHSEVRFHKKASR